MASLRNRVLFISLIMLVAFIAPNASASINTTFNSPSDGNTFVYGYPVDFNATVAVAASMPPNQVGVVNYSWDSNVDGQLSTNTSFSTSALSVGSHLAALTVTHYENKAIGFAVRAVGTESWNTTTYTTETYKAKASCSKTNNILTGVIGGMILGYVTEGLILGVAAPGYSGPGVSSTGALIGAGAGLLVGASIKCSDVTKTRTVPVNVSNNGTVTADSSPYNYFVNETDANKLLGTFRPSLSNPNGGTLSNIKYYLVNVTMPDGNVDAGPVTTLNDGITGISINENTGEVYASTSSTEQLIAGLRVNVIPQVHDVEVSSLSVPVDSVVNTVVPVNSTVRNNGNVPESITVRMRDGNILLASDSFNLTAGQSIASGNLPFDALSFTPAAPGLKNVSVGIDAITGDANPGNDSLSASTNVMTYNQAITLTLSASSPIYVNNSFVLTANVRNNSDVNLDVPLFISLPSGLSLAGEVANKTVSGLQPDANGQANWNINTTSKGPYDIDVTAFFGIVKTTTVVVNSVYNRAVVSVDFPATTNTTEQVDFNVVVRNTGIKTDSFNVSLITNGGTQDSELVSLNAGQSTQVSLNYAYPAAGNYDVNIVADFNSEEAALLDNYIDGTINVVDPVSNASIQISAPNSVFNLTKFTVKAYVWNNGDTGLDNVVASISLAPGLVLDSGETSDKTIPGTIAPGNYGVAQWEVNSTMTPGNINASVSAFSGAISDSKFVNVIMAQNRKINSLILPVPSISQNTLTFTVEVENQAKFDESFIVRFFVNGVEEDNTIVNLIPSSLQDINFLHLFSSPGTYDINVNADVNANESNSNDNNAYASLTVVDANTIVSANVSAPAAVLQNASFNVTGYVFNIGSDDLSNVPVSISLETGLDLNAGETASKVIPFIAAGDFGSVIWDVNSGTSTGLFDVNVTAYNTVKGTDEVQVT